MFKKQQTPQVFVSVCVLAFPFVSVFFLYFIPPTIPAADDKSTQNKLTSFLKKSFNFFLLVVQFTLAKYKETEAAEKFRRDVVTQN